MEEEEQQERHFIGFDFSTQQIKAVVVNSGLEVTAETHVHFDSMLLNSTTRGNYGNLGMYFDHPEIVPDGLLGDFRFNKSDEAVSRFASNETEVRALVEGQLLAKRLHAEKIGFKITADTRILVTGGASVNLAILQVVADVFNAKVFTQSAANSAAMGGAYRAVYLAGGGTSSGPFAQVTGSIADSAELKASPSKDAAAVYGPMLERFKKLEASLVEDAAKNKA